MKLAYTLGVVVAAIGLFVGGWFLGASKGFFANAGASSLLANEIGKAGYCYELLDLLEAGEIEKAKARLNAELDGAMIVMDDIRRFCPAGDSTRAAQNLLVMIVDQRSQHPVKSNEWVQKILENVLKQREKQNKVPESIGTNAPNSQH